MVGDNSVISYSRYLLDVVQKRSTSQRFEEYAKYLELIMDSKKFKLRKFKLK